MFERYTERARRVIFFARYEASVFGSACIDTEHLLLGLLREGKGPEVQILLRNEVSHQSVQRQLESRAAAGPRTSTAVDIPLSGQARRVLEHAAEEADRMSAPHVGTEHLLLGLLAEAESDAGRLLRSNGLRLEEVREELRLGSLTRETPPRPKEAFSKLAHFVGALQEKGARYHVSAVQGGEAMRVEVAVPEERWAATLFADGRVAVEVFGLTGAVQDEAALARLLSRIGPTREDKH